MRCNKNYGSRPVKVDKKLPGSRGQLPFNLKIATATSMNNQKWSDSRSSRRGVARMKCSGQSRKDPSVQMRTKKSPYFNSVISSQHITHVDPRKGRAPPCNFIKHNINVGTWDVLSLESSSSKVQAV